MIFARLSVVRSPRYRAAVLMLSATFFANSPATAQSGTTASFEVIAKYAPLIYLSKDENFMPDTLEAFAAGVHMECDNKTLNIPMMKITATDLSTYGYGGPHDTPRCRLTTNEPMGGAYDVKPFFHGRKPTSNAPVPVYVYTYDIKNPTTFIAQYNTFYPYNEGKAACPLFVVNGNCTAPSGRKVFDDHVADWELMSIRFENGKPVAVHVGAHGNYQSGDEYTASTYLPVKAPGTGEIKWESTVKQYKLGDFLSGVGGNGPWYLEWEGDHPIVYSAKGSHGIWAQPGPHYYRVAAGDLLSDDTDPGFRWETWHQTQDVTLMPYANLMFAYEGDWGNAKMGKSVCDYVKDVIDATPASALARWGYEFFTDSNVCDKLSESLKDTHQLNGGPSIPDRERDKAYIEAPPPPPPPPPCIPVAPKGLAGVSLYAIGRDSILYSKQMSSDGPWVPVPGYASALNIVSIAARGNKTLVGLDDHGGVFELSPPYSGDWSQTSVQANPLIRGITVSHGLLLGVTAGGIQQLWTNHWEPLAEGLTSDPAPKTIAAMPNGHYLVGTPIGRGFTGSFGYGGNFFEYREDNGLLEPLSWGIDHPFPVTEPALYPKELLETFPNNKPQSFTLLPNGKLIYSTEIGTDRLIGWYVDNCGNTSTETFSNAGAPTFGGPLRNGTSAETPQWQSLTFVVR